MRQTLYRLNPYLLQYEVCALKNLRLRGSRQAALRHQETRLDPNNQLQTARKISNPNASFEPCGDVSVLESYCHSSTQELYNCASQATKTLSALGSTQLLHQILVWSEVPSFQAKNRALPWDLQAEHLLLRSLPPAGEDPAANGGNWMKLQS